jgi:Zn finger protein HypA/HybF involved in hydrogenase expression
MALWNFMRRSTPTRKICLMCGTHVLVLDNSAACCSSCGSRRLQVIATHPGQDR